MTDYNRDLMRLQLPLFLAHKLKEISPQYGKTVLMKMAYLLQEVYEVPLGYRFSLYTYGPYSSEVLADLDRSRYRGWVNVEYIEDEVGFQITLGQNAATLSELKDSFKSYEAEVEEVVENFGRFRAKELELRTTISYVWSKLGGPEEQKGNQVIESVSQLKPHFKKGEIQTALEELMEMGVVSLARK
ncbi:MAG: hypothetical protein OXR67_06735 [Chloroflexota bacterium]|nr:hypothetical protein [Chloroflexota bacterium]